MSRRKPSHASKVEADAAHADRKEVEQQVATATVAKGGRDAAASASSASNLELLFRHLAQESDASPSSPFSSSALLLTLLVTSFAMLLRYLVSGGSYSGFSTPPMYGDYEAQRHWMELTINLPIQQWYFNGTNNNLQYWGLDYPPLTAYVSWLFGKLAQRMGEHELVALGSSHGYESISSKYFMRMTVIISDALCFLPALFLAIHAINHTRHSFRPSWQRMLLYFLLCISPLFILIDHGHFQYNCVSLGLVCWAVWLLYRGNELLASVAFVFSLCFKQMSLYYAPAFFFYLLARTRVGKRGANKPFMSSVFRLAVIGAAVIASFLLMFAPFLYPFSQLAQVFHRMFPFARGLFEDKVANFWCATSILIKWNVRFERDMLVKCSLIATCVAFLPNCLHVFFYPSRKSFLHTLVGCAWAFYLFSFQVHEKTVLLPMLPLSLLIGTQPLLVAWSTIVATFSMYPLLEKDGHAWSYSILQVFFACAALSYARAQQLQGQSNPNEEVKRREAVQPSSSLAAYMMRTFDGLLSPTFRYRLVQLSLLGLVALHAVWLLLPPVPRLPDLKVMLFVLYAAAHFVLFYLTNLLQQWSLPLQEVEDEDFFPRNEWEQQKTKAQ